MRTRSVLAAAMAAILMTAAVVTAEREALETILIRVNDRIITVNDFKLRLRQELSQMQPVPMGKDLRDFTEGLFNTIVDEMIIMERAEERRLKVEEATVDSAIDNLRVENELEDDAAWQAALETSGMSIEQLRERYRHSILLSRTVQSEVRATEITEEEVRRRYEEEKSLYKMPEKVDLEQLFFPIKEDNSDYEQVARVARGLVERVSEGSDLRAEATLAGVEVQELGEIPTADLRSDLRAALDGVPDGGFTEAIETAGGIQVIRLVKRIPEGFQPFEEVEESIKRRMSFDSYQEQSSGFVQGLKEEYLVEIDQKQLDFILDMVESL